MGEMEKESKRNDDSNVVHESSANTDDTLAAEESIEVLELPRLGAKKDLDVEISSAIAKLSHDQYYSRVAGEEFLLDKPEAFKALVDAISSGELDFHGQGSAKSIAHRHAYAKTSQLTGLEELLDEHGLKRTVRNARSDLEKGIRFGNAKQASTALEELSRVVLVMDDTESIVTDVSKLGNLRMDSQMDQLYRRYVQERYQGEDKASNQTRQILLDYSKAHSSLQPLNLLRLEAHLNRMDHLVGDKLRLMRALAAQAVHNVKIKDKEQALPGKSSFTIRATDNGATADFYAKRSSNILQEVLKASEAGQTVRVIELQELAKKYGDSPNRVVSEYIPEGSRGGVEKLLTKYEVELRQKDPVADQDKLLIDLIANAGNVLGQLQSDVPDASHVRYIDSLLSIKAGNNKAIIKQNEALAHLNNSIRDSYLDASETEQKRLAASYSKYLDALSLGSFDQKIE